MALDSIGKMRDNVLKYAPNIRREICMALDEIEAEVVDTHIELPKLDDGPIKVGDLIKTDYDDIKCVREVEALIWDGYRWDFQLSDEEGDTRDCASLHDFYECSRHIAKADCLKDLLEEFGNRVANSGHQWGLDAAGLIDEFDGRIRELMEVVK